MDFVDELVLAAFNNWMADDYAGDSGYYHVIYTRMLRHRQHHPASIQDVFRANSISPILEGIAAAQQPFTTIKRLKRGDF
jgi:hypothetical protein